MTRILFSLFAASLLFTVPWYLYSSVVIAGFFVYKGYYEGIVIGFLIDVVYGVGEFWFSFCFFILFFLSIIIRKYLR